MILYLSTILISMFLIVLFNCVFNPFSLPIWIIMVSVVVGTIAVIIIDGLFAYIIRRLPNIWFSKDRKIFKVPKWEVNFYNKIGIRKWKDKVLELGAVNSFRKNKIYEPTNNEYVSKFIMESNYGIVIHIVGIFMGFLLIFLYPFEYILMFPIPICIVNAFLNILPTFILRYNIPKLLVLYKRNERNSKIDDSKT